MAALQKRRRSTRQSSNRQNLKDEYDSDLRNPFAPTDNSDTNDESEVSEYGKKGKKRRIKKRKATRKIAWAKALRGPNPPVMSDIEYDMDAGSPELQDCIEVRKPATPTIALSRANRRALETVARGVPMGRPEEPNVVQLHLNAGAAAGGTTINIDLCDLVLGKRSYNGIGSASLPTPDGSDAPDSPNRLAINKKRWEVRTATPEPWGKRPRLLQDADARTSLSCQPKKGFCDIPYELRVR